MGRRNYLIEGVSGTGKTSVAEELERRGYHVIHGDRVLAYYGDPATGERLERPAGLSADATAEWGYPRWIWPVQQVLALQEELSHDVTFFCGGARNTDKFVHGFDKVFVLDVDRDVLKSRLASRGDDEFGGKPAELDIVLRFHAIREIIRPDSVRVDTGQPVNIVVDVILRHCGLN